MFLCLLVVIALFNGEMVEEVRESNKRGEKEKKKTRNAVSSHSKEKSWVEWSCKRSPCPHSFYHNFHFLPVPYKKKWRDVRRRRSWALCTVLSLVIKTHLFSEKNGFIREIHETKNESFESPALYQIIRQQVKIYICAEEQTYIFMYLFIKLNYVCLI